MKSVIIFFIILFPFTVAAQGIQVEYDKKHDFTQYKTFALGEGEIVTPKDQRTVKDATLHTWVRSAIAEELKEKGLQQQDSLADLTVSYVIGSLPRTDIEPIGPLGQTPGSNSQTWSRDYNQGSLIIDLNNKNNQLVWRVNGTTNSTSSDASRMISQVVAEGFRKFTIKAKKEKKK